MSKIINFMEAQTKKLKEEKMHFDAFMHLSSKLQDQAPENFVEIIRTFLEGFKENDEFIPVIINLITTHTDLKFTIEKIIITLTYTDQEHILEIIEELWPKETDLVNRLRHIVKLSHFCSKQVPQMPFSQIIPRSILMKFLSAAHKE